MKAYTKFNCNLKNEAKVEEELEEEDLTLEDAEKEYFEEDQLDKNE